TDTLEVAAPVMRGDAFALLAVGGHQPLSTARTTSAAPDRIANNCSPGATGIVTATGVAEPGSGNPVPAVTPEPPMSAPFVPSRFLTTSVWPSLVGGFNATADVETVTR